MNFSVHYFDLPLKANGKDGYREVDIKTFWENAESEVPGIKNGVGVYVLGRKYGKNYTPFYVGKTSNSFYSEVCHSHKLRKYEKCAREEKGDKCIVLVVARTGTGKISTKKDDTMMGWLESLFIGYAYQQNEKLYNVAKLKYFKAVSVPDILNSAKGVSDKSSRVLKNMLLGNSPKK